MSTKNSNKSDYISRAVYFFLKTRIHFSILQIFLLAFIIDTFSDSREYLPVIISFAIWNYALYLFDRAYDASLDNINSSKEAISMQMRSLLIGFTVLLSFLPILILIKYHFSILPYLPFIPITFLYNLRIFPGKKAIKFYFLLKNLYSAIFIWTLPVIVTLKFYVHLPNHFLEIYSWFWSFVYAVIMGEIIWDIRDVKGDAREGLKTVPVLLGIPKTKQLLLLSLLCFYIPFSFWRSQFDWQFLATFFIFILIAKPTLPKWIFHVPVFITIFKFSYIYFVSHTY